jgi:hypothetical protein
MSDERTKTFAGLSDLKSKFCDLFEGPSFYSAFTKLDDKLRKKIMIAVSVANNCTE